MLISNYKIPERTLFSEVKASQILELPKNLREDGGEGSISYVNDSLYIKKESGWEILNTGSDQIFLSGNGISIENSVINLSQKMEGSTGGTSLINNGDPELGNYSLKNLSAGHGIILSEDLEKININLSRNIQSSGSGQTIVMNGNPSSDYVLKSFVSGDGVAISPLSDSLKIDLTRRIVNSGSLGESVIVNGLPTSDYSVKRIAGGQGISSQTISGSVILSLDRRIVDASSNPEDTSMIFQGNPSSDFSLKKLRRGFGILIEEPESGVVQISQPVDTIRGRERLFFQLADEVISPSEGYTVDYKLAKIGQQVFLTINSLEWRLDDPRIGNYSPFFTINDIPQSWMPTTESRITKTGFPDGSSIGKELVELNGITSSVMIWNDNPRRVFTDSIVFVFGRLEERNSARVFFGLSELYFNEGPRLGEYDGGFLTPTFTWSVI